MSGDTQTDWRTELADGAAEDMRRQINALVQTAREIAAGSGRQFAKRIGRVAGSALEEILAPAEQVPVIVELPAARLMVTAYPVQPIVMSGSLRAAKARIAGTGIVTNPAERETRIGVTVAYVLLIMATSGLLGVRPDGQAAVSYYLAVIEFALGIGFFLWDKRR